jgi:hypothetical protein
VRIRSIRTRFFRKTSPEQRTDDDKSCRDFLSAKAGTTDKADIDKVVRTQFFLAIKDCSNKFSLPVIALHNNAVNDTAKYHADTKAKGEFKLDVDKSNKSTGEDDVKALKKSLA